MDNTDSIQTQKTPVRAGQTQVGFYLLPRDWQAVKGIVTGEEMSMQAFLGDCVASAMEHLTGKAPKGLRQSPCRASTRRLSAVPKRSGPPSRIGKVNVMGHLPKEQVLRVNTVAAKFDIRRQDMPAIGLVLEFARRGLDFPDSARDAVGRLAKTAPGKADAILPMAFH